MSASISNKCPWLKRFIRNLPGTAQPILAEASDGHLYVVKLPCMHQSPNLLFNEAAGTELYRAFNLPVPDWSPLIATDSFLDQNPSCSAQAGNLRPRSAQILCFGSRFLGEDGSRLLEILPGAFFNRVTNRTDFWLAWLLDICSRHADNRQAIFREDIHRTLNVLFIDHGHMFGGPKGEQRVHFEASQYLDWRIYPSTSSRIIVNLQKAAGTLRTNSLERKIQRLPDEWKTPSALQRFAECMDRLARPRLLPEIFESMFDSVLRKNERDESKVRSQSPNSLLCPRVQTREVRLGAA